MASRGIEIEYEFYGNKLCSAVEGEGLNALPALPRKVGARN